MLCTLPSLSSVAHSTPSDTLTRTPSIKHKFRNQFVSCLNIPDGHILAHCKPWAGLGTAREKTAVSGIPKQLNY